MVSNRQLRKEVFALYAGVPVEKLSGKHYDKIRDGIRMARRAVLQEAESDIMMHVTLPLSKRASRFDMPLEEATEIEKNALVKLRDYKAKELEKLYQWDNELYGQIQNSAYMAPLIEKQAVEYLQNHTQNVEGGKSPPKESQLIQMVRDTIAINEHYKRTPLERLGLNTRMYNILRKLGAKNAMDIAQYSKQDILEQSQVGEDSVKKLQAKMNDLGLFLR